MPARSSHPHAVETPRRNHPARAIVLGLAVVLVLAVVLLAGRQPLSHAEETVKVDIAYLYVTGEGATAKAWYDGAPSPGVPVQDALNKFATEGYRVARITENLRSQEADAAMVFLLQRIR